MEEIPPSLQCASAWPDDKVETVSVSHLIVARKTLSERRWWHFRQLFAVRQAIARQVPGAAHRRRRPERRRPGTSGAAAVIDGTERTFLDRYGDYFWLVSCFSPGSVRPAPGCVTI